MRSIIAAIVVLSVGLGFVNEYRSELRGRGAARRHPPRGAACGATASRQRVDVPDLVPGDVVGARASATSCPPTCGCSRPTQLECDEAVLTGESHAGGRRRRRPTARRTRPSTCRRAPSWAPSCTRASGGASSWRPARRPRSATIAVGLGERQAETAFQVGLRDFSKLLVRVAGVADHLDLRRSTSRFDRPLLEALLFSLAIAIGITPQLLPAIVSVSLVDRLARAGRASGPRQAAGDASRTSATSRSCSPTRPGTLTEGAITFDAAARRRRAAGRRAPLLLGLVCNEATVTADGPGRRQRARPSRCGARRRRHARRRPSRGLRAARGPALRPRAPAGVRRSSTTADGRRRCSSPRARPRRSSPAASTSPAEAQAVLERPVRRRRPRRRRRHARGARPDHARPPPTSTTCASPGFLTFVDRPKADAGAVDRAARPPRHRRQDHHRRQRRGRRQGLPRHRPRRSSGSLTGAELDALDDDALAAAIPAHDRLRARQPRAEVAHHQGRARAAAPTSPSSATASTTPSPCTPPTSASRSTRPTDVAKDAADIVLLDKDLGVLADGVIEGRRIFANTLKYVLMATSSNFGNMFSAAGASLFLSFLPMLPVADPAQQPALRRRPARHPDRQRRRGGARPARGLGHRLRPPLHDRLRPDQLDLRLPDVLRHARRPPRRPRRVPHRLVRRVARHPDPRRLRHPHPPRARSSAAGPAAP